MTRADTCLLEHMVTRAVVVFASSCVTVHAAELSCMGQVNKRLEVCLSVNPPVDAFARFTILLNDDANSFARYEPNTTDGPEDHGAAWRAARTGSVCGASDQGAVSTQWSPPWSGLGMNILGPTLKFETRADPTGPSTVARRRSG